VRETLHSPSPKFLNDSQHSKILINPTSTLGNAVLKAPRRPLHDRVVVKRIDAEDKSAGGIIIPDTAKEKPSQGEVIAVGPGGRDEAGKLIPIDVKDGDRVLFGKWSGTEVKIDGQELLIMKESDIMGIIDEPVSKRKAA
jgi:chaperonin GroES